MLRSIVKLLCLAILISFIFNSSSVSATDTALRDQAVVTMHKASEFYSTQVASHGGYVYLYALDIKDRWGEGQATADQIWVQPPGTPAVGMAYLKAYYATGDKFYLDAAKKAAEALVYGQLESGGWTNCIDFDPKGKRVARYRNGKGRGKNNSSLDDGQTQSAIRLLAQVDQALDFKNRKIHQSVMIALDALLSAQFPNGAFPQIWTGPVKQQPILKASYPDYDWRSEGKIKNYWDMYTLNDNVAGYVTQTLIDVYKIYGDEKYKTSLEKLGDFLILAQMPEPQSAWAQQYNYDMKPIWARRFEPAAITAGESQQVIETLMDIFQITQDYKYLKPIPRALAYLKSSLLSDGRLARYYELKSNKPLYMFRKGDIYTLTYDDSNLPKHYSFKVGSRLQNLKKRYNELTNNAQLSIDKPSVSSLEGRVRNIIAELDDQGRWVNTYKGEGLAGQPKFERNSKYISSEVFSRNIEILSQYLTATKTN